MLTISTIAEALAELEKQTGRAWTDSELFDVATNRGVELHAAPPITAQTTIQKFVNGKGLVEKFRSEPGHAALAVLFPRQVGQLWITGETLTSHPNKHDQTDGEYQWFTEPVRVTREQVRIKAESLKKILTVWSQAQAGRWLESTTKPQSKLYQSGPDWMFPTEPQPAPAQTVPAPVVAAGAKPDTTLMATRKQLIDAFGAFTGMDAQWFSTVKDTPALLAARKVTGQGGRGHIAEPLFCPFEVLQWLIDNTRRKGRPLGQKKGWELFEGHFPRAYAAFSVGDPRTN